MNSAKTQEFWEVAVRLRKGERDPRGEDVRRQVGMVLVEGALVTEGLSVDVVDLYFFEGEGLSSDALEPVARRLLSDPVTQEYTLRGVGSEPDLRRREAESSVGGGPEGARHEATVLRKAGVMDPVEGSLHEALADFGLGALRVRTGARTEFRWSASAPRGGFGAAEKVLVGGKVLSNPAIEEVHWEDAEVPRPFQAGVPYEFEYREVPLEGLSDDELLAVSRRGQLSLNLDEMKAIRDHFAREGRAPSDAELETLAQTWSEHCCHKTLTGSIEHTVPGRPTRVFGNLLRETIKKATDDIAAPWCLSVFVDNAGAIEFDEDLAVTFKVETHNHPSAIEPYGGAGTGIGGVLRDTAGTGLGAKPIVNTDVFCFGPPDLPASEVPPGALHPLRVLRGVVAGVRDYGNRMGIPTASGAVYFDRRYVGNPLVYCGSVGIIPRALLAKEVLPGDRIYVLGGRTGRDGIHGATFSSAELTQHSESVSSGAVQIGNAITEKTLFDVVLAARDRALYRSITDCGAGGLSSAVGEMGSITGAEVHLDRVPLKYEGLRPWEIWVSEAQERMVLAVPPDRTAALEALARSESVECTDLGVFSGTGRLVLLYEDHRVCDLAVEFLHEGRPKWHGVSRLVPADPSGAPEPSALSVESPGKTLHALLSMPNIASKEWIIRQYDHEVQGRSILKPLQGSREDGPGDGVVFAPRFGSPRGIALGCGMNPLLGDLDPYRMALWAVDEAVRNVVAVGGDFERTALLDNFCWGNTERPEVLGSLVEAAVGCHDAAVAFRTPFISGKDSLRNEFRVGDRLISIPPSLLISSISTVEDVRKAVSMDLKESTSRLVLVGRTYPEMGGSHYRLLTSRRGGEVPLVRLEEAARIHAAVSRILREGLVLSSHDLSEGGLAVAAAEMAFSGEVGLELCLDRVSGAGDLTEEEALFSESPSRYLLEVRPALLEQVLSLLEGLPAADVGQCAQYKILRVLGFDSRVILAEALRDLKASWKRPLDLG